MGERRTGIAVPSLRRLPLYLRYLLQLERSGVRTVSCRQISEAMGVGDATQVRKDLAEAGAAGRPRVGYEVSALVTSVRCCLGWCEDVDAFLVGAGNLGAALMNHDGFADCGLRIVAAFDVDPERAQRRVPGKAVLPLCKLPELGARMGVRIGINTAPPDAAQLIADLMVASGLRAIWNFAPVTLDVPGGVVVENANLRSSWAALSGRLDTEVKCGRYG